MNKMCDSYSLAMDRLKNVRCCVIRAVKVRAVPLSPMQPNRRPLRLLRYVSVDQRKRICRLFSCLTTITIFHPQIVQKKIEYKYPARPNYFVTHCTRHGIAIVLKHQRNYTTK